MFRFCLLLSCIVALGAALETQETYLESSVTAAAAVKEAQDDETEMKALREKAAQLQKELSEIPVDSVASVSLPVATSESSDIKDAGEVSFKLPQDNTFLAVKADPAKADEAKNSLATPDAKALATPDAAKDKDKEASADAKDAEEAEEDKSKDKGKAEAKDDDKAKVAVVPAPAAGKDKKKNKKPSNVPFVRPNAGKGPEIIEFGLFGKTFYGINLKDNNFVIDVVMTLKWTDKRVADLIPAGLDKMTLSKLDSTRSMWLPQIAITNRDIKKYDLISTAVMINKKGEVFKVERATAVIKDKYMLEHYPYDFQDLVVKIASIKYMIDEVVLKPATEGIGVQEGLFKGYSYDLVNVGASAIRDVDGALKKSRGLLTIRVKRDSSAYTQSHLIPAFLTVCISCGIHYFPFVAPFITPRVALGVLALLAFTNLSIASNMAMPAGAPFNWNDLLNQTIMTIMFTNIALNVLAECFFHQLHADDVARSMNMEYKWVMPSIVLLSVTIIMSTAGPGGIGLTAASYLVKMLPGGLLACYLAFCVSRCRKALAAKAQAEDAKKAAEAAAAKGKAAAGGDAGGDGGGD